MRKGKDQDVAPVTDLSGTLTTATDDELRRRAADGDQSALAELNRRAAEALCWAEAAA